MNTCTQVEVIPNPYHFLSFVKHEEVFWSKNIVNIVLNSEYSESI